MLLERPDENSPWTPSNDFDTASTLLELDKNIRDGLDKIATFLNDMYVYPVIQFGGGIRF